MRRVILNRSKSRYIGGKILNASQSVMNLESTDDLVTVMESTENYNVRSRSGKKAAKERLDEQGAVCTMACGRLQRTWGNPNLGQGLGYSGDSPAKVLTKFCTPNVSPKKFWPCTNRFLSSQAFQPCMTLWVQN